MTPEQSKAQRVNILQKSIDSLTGIQGRRVDLMDGLDMVNEILNDYPPYKNSGKEQKADRMVILGRSKIGFGLIGDLPAKEAIRSALSYLCNALGFLVD